MLLVIPIKRGLKHCYARIIKIILIYLYLSSRKKLHIFLLIFFNPSDNLITWLKIKKKLSILFEIPMAKLKKIYFLFILYIFIGYAFNCHNTSRHIYDNPWNFWIILFFVWKRTRKKPKQRSFSCFFLNNCSSSAWHSCTNSVWLRIWFYSLIENQWRSINLHEIRVDRCFI